MAGAWQLCICVKFRSIFNSVRQFSHVYIFTRYKCNRPIIIIRVQIASTLTEAFFSSSFVSRYYIKQVISYLIDIEPGTGVWFRHQQCLSLSQTLRFWWTFKKQKKIRTFNKFTDTQADADDYANKQDSCSERANVLFMTGWIINDRFISFH